MRKLMSLSAAVVTLGLVTTPAAAQLAGQPVYAIPGGTGVTLNGDLGIGIDPSDFFTVAGRVSLGLPMVSFTVGFEPELIDAFENQIMGGAAVSIMPMPVSLRIQATAGYGLDSKNLTVPAGLVIGFDVPSPSMTVDPWVFPQARILVPDVGDTEVDFGISAGVNLSLPGGIGGHVALDYDNFFESFGAGIGIHYNVSVPGLGGM